MQPQDAGPGEWGNLLSGMLGAIFGGGGIFGLLRWIYRAGGKEPELRSEWRKEIEAAERRAEERVEDMVGHFREALDGMRQTIASVQKEALPKDDFHRFRSEDLAAAERRRLENRDDFARLERKIDQILSRQ